MSAASKRSRLTRRQRYAARQRHGRTASAAAVMSGTITGMNRAEGPLLPLLPPPSRVPLRRIWQAAVATICFWALVILLAKIADTVSQNQHTVLDKEVLQWVHGFASPALDTLALAVTAAGGMQAVALAMVLGCGLLWYRRHRAESMLLLFGIGGAAIANQLLKLLFHRTRPALWPPLVVEHSYSFPSGHAMASAALAACVVVVLWRTRWRRAAIIASALYVAAVGLTRLYLGVHFPTDVVAGWLVSIAWVLIVATILGLPPMERAAPAVRRWLRG